jgi:hypothetical protein
VVPTDVSRTVLRYELPAAAAWCERHRWKFVHDLEHLRLSYELIHPKTEGAMRLEAECDGYRALPPKWRFLDSTTGAATRQVFPSPGTVPGVQGSIFHGNGVICAPWNLLAYHAHGGPHQDWGDGATWHVDRPPYTRATNVAEMLSVIAIHLEYSPGMLA